MYIYSLILPNNLYMLHENKAHRVNECNILQISSSAQNTAVGWNEGMDIQWSSLEDDIVHVLSGMLNGIWTY